MAKILLIDADTGLCQRLGRRLEREGYMVDVAHDGESGFMAARRSRPSLVMMDAKLPVLDGFAVCRMLRFESDVPILILTEYRNEADRVLGLDLGADDYVLKPFLENELLARVRALLRRGARPLGHVQSMLVNVDDIQIDLGNRRVFRGEEEVHLAHKEFDLLSCLLDHRGSTISREALLEQVWGADVKSDIRTIDVHVRWLRAKLEPDPARPRYIQTVRGVGYRFSEEASTLRKQRAV